MLENCHLGDMQAHTSALCVRRPLVSSRFTIGMCKDTKAVQPPDGRIFSTHWGHQNPTERLPRRERELRILLITVCVSQTGNSLLSPPGCPDSHLGVFLQGGTMWGFNRLSQAHLLLSGISEGLRGLVLFQLPPGGGRSAWGSPHRLAAPLADALLVGQPVP